MVGGWRIGLATVLLAAAAGREDALAQAAGARAGLVQGRIQSNGGEAVPYAVVALTPSFGQRFTDETGAFAFANVPPGSYRLLVRQVGFRPFDTTVVKVRGAPIELTVSLERLAVELATITVVVSRHCTDPGPPDSAASPELWSIFDQLRQNAQRFALLADSYPFSYRMERTFTDYDATDHPVTTSVDTMTYRSNARSRYRPGEVVGFGRGPERTSARVLRLPTLADLADDALLASHCFAYAGTGRRDGQDVVRFQFQPTESLLMADIEGEVELDARTYQVRFATVRLTHVGRAMPGLQSAADSITFTELFPNIVLASRVEGTLVPSPSYGARRNAGRSTEVQRLLDVRFLRELPAKQAPGP